MIKFDPSNKPSFVVQDLLVQNHDANGNVILEIIGYYVNVEGIGDIRLSAGDYIDDSTSTLKVYRKSEYDLSDTIKNLVHEKIGKDVVRDLYKTLRSQNLTQAQEGDLIGRIYPVIGSLGDGFIRGARVVANNIAVAGQYTQVRKDYLLGKIDEAILKL